MSRGSYLGLLARRVGPNPPGFAPPKFLPGESPVAAFEDEGLPSRPAHPTASSPSAPRRPEPSPEPAAPPANAPSLPARPGPTPVSQAPSEDPDPEPAASRVPAPAPRPPRAPGPERSPADFVFEAPRRLVRPQWPAVDEGPRDERAAAAPHDAKVDAEPIAPEPSASEAWAPIEPDPVAAALVAAVRWTSSEPPAPPPARAAEPAMVRPPIRDGRPAPVERHDQGAGQPDPARQTAAAPATTTERFADVHIGSIEVEISSPPEAQERETAKAAPETPRAPVIPLTRKFTSHYGLHQR